MKRRYVMFLIAIVISIAFLAHSVCAQSDENAVYSVAAQVQDGALSAGGNDVAVVLSVRHNPENEDLHDIRFCAVVKNDLFDRKAKIKFKIEFYKDGKTITEHTPILSRKGGEFVLYRSIYANKVEYTAEEGSSIYVSTVSNIPSEAWDSLVINAQFSYEYESLGKLKYDTVFDDLNIVSAVPAIERETVWQPRNSKDML